MHYHAYTHCLKEMKDVNRNPFRLPPLFSKVFFFESMEQYFNYYFIFFSAKPIVTIQQCRTPVTEGDNVTLHCNATGFPVPNISWIKASSGYVESRTKTLLVTAITRGESSNYICHASNEIGNDTQTCEIDVHCKLY